MTDLFTPNNKRYCCGADARRQKFAQKWERIQDLLNPILLPKLKNYINDYYLEHKELPTIVLKNNNVELVYSKESIEIK